MRAAVYPCKSFPQPFGVKTFKLNNPLKARARYAFKKRLSYKDLNAAHAAKSTMPDAGKGTRRAQVNARVDSQLTQLKARANPQNPFDKPRSVPRMLATVAHTEDRKAPISYVSFSV